jgi:hypothetical protein
LRGAWGHHEDYIWAGHARLGLSQASAVAAYFER